MEVNSDQEARQLAELYGEPSTSEEDKQRIVQALTEYKQRRQVEAPAETPAPAPQEESPPQQVPAPAEAPPPSSPQPRSWDEKAAAKLDQIGRGVWDAVAVGQDATMFLGLGLASTVAGGLSGLWGAAFSDKEDRAGLSRMDYAAQMQRTVTDAIAWRPQTEILQDALGIVAEPMGKLDNVVINFSEAAADAVTPFGDEPNPATSTAIYTAIWGIPEILGIKASTAAQVTKAGARQAAYRQAKKRAADMGINPKNIEMAPSVVRKGKEMANDVKGVGAADAAEGVARAKAKAKRKRDQLYDELSSSKAQTSVKATDKLHDDIVKDLENNFQGDLSEGARKSLISILDDLGDLGNKQPMKRNPLSEATPKRTSEVFTAQVANLLAIRKRISQTRRGLSNETDKAAYSAVLRNIDDFMDAGIDEALKYGLNATDSSFAISGPAKDIKRIHDARKYAAEYYKLYDDNHLIKKIAKNEMTPNELVNGILGSSALGVKPGSLRTVNLLKKILGKDSPEFKAVQGEMMYYVMDPLLGSKPNLTGFAARYDKFIRNNPDLVKALDLPTEDLDFLARAAEMAGNMPDPGRMGALKGMTKSDILARFLAVETMGSSLAKKALRVSFTRNLLALAIGGGRVPKKQIIKALSGIDPDSAIIRRGTKTWAALALPAAPLSVLNEIKYNPEDYQREKLEQEER